MLPVRRLALVACSALLLAGLAACGDDGDSADGDATLTVYAAASLTKTFEQIGDEFEKEHDGVTVEFSFGGSSDLVAQIQEGAPADVFASADTANMDKLTGDDLQATDPQTSPPTPSRSPCRPTTRPASRRSPTSPRTA